MDDATLSYTTNLLIRYYKALQKFTLVSYVSMTESSPRQTHVPFTNRLQ